MKSSAFFKVNISKRSLKFFSWEPGMANGC